MYRAIAHPRWLELTTGSALALSTVALIWMLFAKWRREGRMLPPSFRSSAFLITVWSWTIYSSVDRLVQYVIPALHSVQYLYFVWLMKRNEAREGEGPPLFGRPVAVRLGVLALSALGLGWFLFRGAPWVLDGTLVSKHARGTVTDALGETPVLRSDLRRGEHPPLLHGLRNLAPRQPRHAVPANPQEDLNRHGAKAAKIRWIWFSPKPLASVGALAVPPRSLRGILPTLLALPAAALTTATATAASLAFLGLVHAECTPVEHRAVQLRDRIARRLR